jgi:DNA ligase-associated metallophosphoesterase
VTTIELAGRALRLLPQKAAYLPGAHTLLVADLHLGKAASFRRLGVPVPEAATASSLERLAALAAATGARRIVLLGDLLHSAHAQGPDTIGALQRWREAHAALDLVLVRGNHDHHAGDPPAPLDIAVLDEPFVVDGIALCHHPMPRAEGYVIAGHLHPCALVGGRARDRLRLPCFWFGAAVGVLPAFGSFTGMHPIRPAPGDRVFVSDGEQVRPLPGLHTLAA